MWIYRKESQADGGSCHPRRSSSALFFFSIFFFLKSPGLLLSSCPYSSASLSLSLCVHNNCIAQIYSELRERERLRKREEEEDNRSRATNELFTRLSDGLEEELDRQRPRKKEGDMAKHVAYCENLTQRIAERTGDVSRDLEQRRRYQCTDTRDALFSLFSFSSFNSSPDTANKNGQRVAGTIRPASFPSASPPHLLALVI